MKIVEKERRWEVRAAREGDGWWWGGGEGVGREPGKMLGG